MTIYQPLHHKAVLSKFTGWHRQKFQLESAWAHQPFCWYWNQKSWYFLPKTIEHYESKLEMKILWCPDVRHYDNVKTKGLDLYGQEISKFIPPQMLFLALCELILPCRGLFLQVQAPNWVKRKLPKGFNKLIVENLNQSYYVRMLNSGE